MNINKSNHTDLIIVGGGIFGASIAYYYKRDNPDKEVIVYERNELCSGYTSMAAALMSRVRIYGHVIPLSLETYRVIPELEVITGSKLPIHYNGAIHLAVKKKNVELLKKMMHLASLHEIEWEYITSHQASQMVPWLNASKAEKIAFIPGEAITDPYLLGMAFANAAKAIGVKFIRNSEITQILKDKQTVIGVNTTEGSFYAETTILAAGVWSINLAHKAGIALPMAPVRSQYWITKVFEPLFPASSPTVLIPEAKYYSRPMGNSLLFGIREANSVYLNPENLPQNIDDYYFNNDNGWDDLEENYVKLLPFFHQFEEIGIKNYIAGFSGYTPDSQFIMGNAPGIDGLLIATGCVGAGISVAGGIGLGIACLAAKKNNPFDFSHYKVDRFGEFDPYSPMHLSRCAAARSKKKYG